MRNTLIQYRGGGYDGCIWEWNFAWFDDVGDFHDVFSSGYSGCKTAAQLAEAMRRDRGVYRYPFRRRAKIEEFVRETNDGLVVGVGRWLRENFPDQADRLLVTCGTCDRRFVADEAFHDGYRGNGGIGVSYEGFVCPDCRDKDSIEPDSIQPVIVIMRSAGKTAV